MMCTQFTRLLHLNSTRITMAANKSNLAKLRKKTGYPFGNCKKALEANNNDLEQAEKWLEEQAKVLGWSKAMKMENRSTLQGLVGIAWDKQYAAIVEVNCETDFVGKNEKFQKLVDMVAKTCLHHTKTITPAPKSSSKMLLDGVEVGKLLATDHQSLSDHVARSVAAVGERIVLRRAAMLVAQAPTCLSALTHPASTSNALLGKYGALLVYTAKSKGDITSQLTKQLCQHIIGMNPAKIHAPPDEPSEVKPDTHERLMETKSETEVEGFEGVEEGEMKVENMDDDETVMMRQKFLLDAERTVADVVAEAGIEVQDFVRFECGENFAESEDENATVARATG